MATKLTASQKQAKWISIMFEKLPMQKAKTVQFAVQLSNTLDCIISVVCRQVYSAN